MMSARYEPIYKYKGSLFSGSKVEYRLQEVREFVGKGGCVLMVLR